MYNDKQQQAVILKGIAHQILNMNMPSIGELVKLLRQFNFDVNYGDKYVVLTTQPEGNLGWKRTPFKHSSSRVNYYMIVCETQSCAEDIAKRCATIYANDISMDYDKVTNICDNSDYICSQYTCNGRTWTVIKNPSWM